VYVSLDHYLGTKGKLGFVITQSIFKSGANEGFRRFQLNNKNPFRVNSVCDLSLCLPFENAINRTSVLITQKGAQTKYPVTYRLWIPDAPRSNVQEADLQDILTKFEIRDWLAAPVEPAIAESTWLTANKNAFPVLQKIVGDRSASTMDHAYAGSCTWLNGVFWVEPVQAMDQRALIRNLGDVGRNKVDTVTVQIEKDFLFPLLRGRDVQAWSVKPSALILVPHYADNFGEPVAVPELKRKYPHTFAFLKRFEKHLRARSGYKQLHHSRPEFYVVGNVGNYTLSSYKVVFKDLTEFFQCAVAGPSALEGLPSVPIVPDHTLLFLTCESAEESHFLAGLLNSIPARVALYSASVGVQTQRYFPTDVSRVRLPTLMPSAGTHGEVVRLSKLCHEQASSGSDTNNTELELAHVAASIWSISDKELKYIFNAYEEIQGFRSGGNPSDPTDERGGEE
jgi:hypothetical protein